MKTVIIVPGLWGGLSKEYYKPLAEVFNETSFLVIRAGSDWEPTEIARQIRQIRGKKIVICLSLGAVIGNLVANDKNTDVYYICPHLGGDFINREHKAYAFTLRHVFRRLASVMMFVTKPFREHRWYPLYGGTKPDNHFLSSYAIFKQLKYGFSDLEVINQVTGVVVSFGDTTADPIVAIKRFKNVIIAHTSSGEDPKHINLRFRDEKFGRSRNKESNKKLSDDAIAYIHALNAIKA